MYNRNINRLTAVIQSPIAPRSTNVLWDDLVSNTLKVYRKGIWTVIGGAGGGGEGSSLYWGYDEIQGVIFPLEQRSVQINGDLTVNGDITARKLSVAELEINGKPFEQYWELDSNTNTLSTTYQVLIKNSLIVEQDTSSGGEGEDTPSGGISGVKVNGVTYYDDNGDGVIDLGTISGGGGTADLSNYYTKAESDARYLALSGGQLYNASTDTPLYLIGNSADAYIGFKDTNNNFLGYYGFSQYTPTVYVGTSASYSLIHSGNIGIYNAGGLAHSNGTVGAVVTSSGTIQDKNGDQLFACGSVTGQAFSKWQAFGSASSSVVAILEGGHAAVLKTNHVERLWVNSSGNVGVGTTELYDANKLRLVNTHPHQHTWYLGSLANESDFSVEFRDPASTSHIYGLYTSINYYTGHVAMQVGRSDGLTNAYGLILQPLGGNVLIGTAIDSGYKLDVNGDISAMSALRIGGCGTSYCGLYPNNQITSSGDSSKLWLYNESGLVLYGTTLEIYPTAILYDKLGIGILSPQYELDVVGGIRATKPIFGYMYGTNNNAAAFIFDKPGSNYTGIGSDGVSDTIRFGACNVQGGWVDYNQKWKFYGDIIVTGDVASA